MEHIGGNNRYQFKMLNCLDEAVEADSPVRQIDQLVDEADTSYFTNSALNDEGRPPYNPKDMLKLYIYGMENGILSSRKLERECKRNIEAMWLMNELQPERKTISNFRHDNVENITRFFNEFCIRLKKTGYIDGKLVAIDGTKIRANNSKRNNYSGKKLERHIEYIDKKIAEYMGDLDKNDKLEELEKRKAKYNLFNEHIKSGEVTEISTTDPDSRLMKQSNNGVDVSYNVQTAVDSRYKLVTGVMVTNEPNDQNQLHKVTKAVKDNLKIEGMTIIADKGYYSTEDFKKCHENNITTIVAKPENKSNKEIINKDEFRYDNSNDCYHCPQGQVLNFSYEDEKGFRRYNNLKACKNCPYKPQCTKGNRREICRHKHTGHAEQNDIAFAANQDIYKQRQQLCEHPFGTVKRTMGIRQFLTRGLTNVTAEAALIFLAYNLKRLRVIHKNDTRVYSYPSFYCFWTYLSHFIKKLQKNNP